MNLPEYFAKNTHETKAREVENVYDELPQKIRIIFSEPNIEIINQKLAGLIDFILDMLSTKGEGLLLYTSKQYTDNDYVFTHTLNVCIISLKIGLRLHLARERLKTLGLMAITHGKEEIAIPQGLAENIKSDKELEEIIKLADVYDALTHPPHYRHTMMPFETLLSIAKTQGSFNRNLIKILLDVVSLYPEGQWIQLSTKEIGKVIKINKELLLRPVVEIIFDREGVRLTEPKVVDLATNYLVHVLRPLTKEETDHIQKL